MGRAAVCFELFDLTDACEEDLTETFDVLAGLLLSALEEAVDFIDRDDTPFDTDVCEGCFGVIDVLLFFRDT